MVCREPHVPIRTGPAGGSALRRRRSALGRSVSRLHGDRRSRGESRLERRWHFRIVAARMVHCASRIFIRVISRTCCTSMGRSLLRKRDSVWWADFLQSGCGAAVAAWFDVVVIPASGAKIARRGRARLTSSAASWKRFGRGPGRPTLASATGTTTATSFTKTPKRRGGYACGHREPERKICC